MQKILKEIFDNAMKKINPWLYVASGAEDVTKVLAEYKYDAIANTQVFKNLQGMDLKVKLIIIAIGFAINARLKVNIDENKPLNLYIKGILTDSFPELGKRLLNGDLNPEQIEKEFIDLLKGNKKNGDAHSETKDEAKDSQKDTPPKSEQPASEKKRRPVFKGAMNPLRRRLRESIDNYNREKEGGNNG